MTINYCKRCGNEYDALTEEVASYLCPICSKPKGIVKKLDKVRLKYLTEIHTSSETQELKNKPDLMEIHNEAAAKIQKIK